jgi:16S rRNA (adenine1518-N6/adenine1519-N6)-dimethyltransferase
MDIQVLKNLMRNNKIKPNFTYGQNFLLDDGVLDTMLKVAKVSKEDSVLEIGPGVGNLTKKLCETAGFVLSVEKDPKFLPILKALKKEYKNLRFEIDDILEFNFAKALEEFDSDRVQTSGLSYKVVANIPYYVTGKILQVFLNAQHKPSSITVLVQKEVARNITAKQGDLSVLPISVQLYGEPKLVEVVPSESFYPEPKVDSAILHIDLFKKPRFVLKDEKKFFSIVKACFAGKRKQIHNTLVNNLRLEKEKVLEVLKQNKIDPVARPQDLSIQNWIDLTNSLES